MEALCTFCNFLSMPNSIGYHMKVKISDIMNNYSK